MEQQLSNRVHLAVGAHTRYIISTSGRLTSLQRYKRLLEDVLHVDVAYLPFHSGNLDNPLINPEKFAATLRSLPCIGGAISRDIKHGIIPFLDELDETAASVQSVNTVLVRSGGRLIGYNTDVLGFRDAIKNGIAAYGKPVHSAVCYGYGGVVSVVVSVLTSLGISVAITGRRPEEARRRALELGCAVWGGDGSPPADLFINAAPVTDRPLDEAPNFLESLEGCHVVFDHEMPGKYLQEYSEKRPDVHYIPGTDMYWPQMVNQWALFLEEFVDADTVRGALKKADSST